MCLRNHPSHELVLEHPNLTYSVAKKTNDYWGILFLTQTPARGSPSLVSNTIELSLLINVVPKNAALIMMSLNRTHSDAPRGRWNPHHPAKNVSIIRNYVVK
jgi:hypothetical protein